MKALPIKMITSFMFYALTELIERFLCYVIIIIESITDFRNEISEATFVAVEADETKEVIQKVHIKYFSMCM